MPQNGKDTILLVQPEDATAGGLVVAQLTENSWSIENGLIDEQTKMGRILAYGQNSESFDMTCYGVKGDAGQEAVLNAIKNKKKLKVWEVDRVQNTTDQTYDATFATCYVESAEKDFPGDGFVEVKATLQVEGSSVEGSLTDLPPNAFEDNTAPVFEPPATMA